MWVGGPPKPMQPIRPHSRAITWRETRSLPVVTSHPPSGSAGARAPCRADQTDRLGGRRWHLRVELVERPEAAPE